MKKRFLSLLLAVVLMIGVCGCEKKESIVIYSSMEEENNQLLQQKVKEKFADLDVIVQSVSTGNSAAKLKTEGTNIEAKIVLDLETSHMKSLESNFADLSDFDQSQYVDGLNTAKNYVTWTKYSVGLIVDKKYMKEHKLATPKTYEDLLKPIYKNLIAMPDPTSSGTGYAFFLNVVNIKGEDGAIEYFKKLKNNMREFTTSGSGPTNLLKQGEIAIAMGMFSQGASAITEGYDFELVELETGCPYNSTSAGIVKGNENDEDVKRLFQWLITDFEKQLTEERMPGKLYKEQENKVKNYPDTVKDADMKDIDNKDVKTKLSKSWEQVNG